jgi:hypothetical protein
VNPCDGSVISRKAFPFTIGRELSKNLVLTTVSSQRLAQHQHYKLTPGSVIRIGSVEWYV